MLILNCSATIPKHAAFVDAIRSAGRVVLTDDDVREAEGMHQFARKPKGYISLWTIANVTFDNNGLHFDFVEPVANLR